VDLSPRLLRSCPSGGEDRPVRPPKSLAALVTVAAVLAVGADAAEPAAASRPMAPTVAAPQQLGPDVPPRLRGGKTVALTFDDGPSPNTSAILQVLRRNHVHATFCMLGVNVRRNPAMARRVIREGHQLCNHSRDHADLTLLSRRRVRAEVLDAQRQIHAATGVTPRTFRFPYGSSDARARRVVVGLHLRRLGWDVDPQDWNRPAARTLTRRVVRHAHPGCVVLMHDGGGDRSHTAASLDATIRLLRARGYRFVLA
jgi:peptidoglycan/xylan/chitin deacetylase (PgdA/CDA1 family)